MYAVSVAGPQLAACPSSPCCTRRASRNRPRTSRASSKARCRSSVLPTSCRTTAEHYAGTASPAGTQTSSCALRQSRTNTSSTSCITTRGHFSSRSALLLAVVASPVSVSGACPSSPPPAAPGPAHSCAVAGGRAALPATLQRAAAAGGVRQGQVEGDDGRRQVRAERGRQPDSHHPMVPALPDGAHLALDRLRRGQVVQRQGRRRVRRRAHAPPPCQKEAARRPRTPIGS